MKTIPPNQGRKLVPCEMKVWDKKGNAKIVLAYETSSLQLRH